jgi:hypothetical protein
MAASDPGVPWETIKPVLLAVITDLAVDQVTSAGGVFEPLKTPKWNAEWGTRKASYVHAIQKQSLYLKITSCVPIGGDDILWEELDTGVVAGDDASGEFDVYQTTTGLRRFVLNLQSWVAEDSDDMSSIATLERLRVRLDFESTREIFRDADLDLTDYSAVRDISKVIDKKMWSIATMDLTFTACVKNTNPKPTGYIERVIITSHENVADVEVDPDLRMIEEHLPDFTEREPNDTVDLVDGLSYVLI